jgi:hypothetical protein
MRSAPPRRYVCPILAFVVTALVSSLAAQEPQLTTEQMKEFLLKAEIIKSRGLPIGITSPERLTLRMDGLTHDAGFNYADERKAIMTFARGGTEVDFVDSYQYNIAAYEVAGLLGLQDMMPVTVERMWRGRKGSLTWWLPTIMMESERLKKKVQPPDPEAWNRQMFKMRVFSQLVYDTDRNLQNVLISSDWKLWMLDFTRAFRKWAALQQPKDLTRCDRSLLQHLRDLNRADVERVTVDRLTSFEINGLMKRRDLLVAHFEKLVAEKGEAAVLY